MTTVPSIPWMPERAWTVARSACAISGLTRSDYSPANVQPDPPCEGPWPAGVPVAGGNPCTPDFLPTFVPAAAPVFVLDGGTGYAQITMAQLLESFDPWIVWWSLTAQIGEGPQTIWQGADINESIVLGCDALTATNWRIHAFGGCPVGVDCEYESNVSLSGSEGTWDCQFTTTYTPLNQGGVAPTAEECGYIPNDCLARYVPWRETPRNPDFAGGEPVTIWTRSEDWTYPDTCVPSGG